MCHADSCVDCNEGMNVINDQKDGQELSSSCDKSGDDQETGRKEGGRTERRYWEEVKRQPGKGNISEIGISLKNPPLSVVCCMKNSSEVKCNSAEICNETVHLIGSTHSVTTNQEPATKATGHSLLSTAAVGHAWPHVNRRGWRQTANEPCNVPPESSWGSRYKYVKNGQWNSRVGNSGENKTTVPYHIVFKKKRETSERGANDGSIDTGCRRTRDTPLDGHHGNVCPTDLAVDVTAATQEMEFDVLTLRDLKLQAGSGGRVIPLSQTPTDNMKVKSATDI